MKKLKKYFLDKNVIKILCNQKTAHELRKYFYTYRTFWLKRKIDIEKKLVVVISDDPIFKFRDNDFLIKYKI